MDYSKSYTHDRGHRQIASKNVVTKQHDTKLIEKPVTSHPK